MRGYFLFICDSSSSEPSLSLLPASCSNFRFFRLLQPKAQHCVPFFPIVISTALSQLWRESGPNNMAPIKTRGLQFLLGENNRMLDPVFFLRSVRFCAFTLIKWVFKNLRFCGYPLWTTFSKTSVFVAFLFRPV